MKRLEGEKIYLRPMEKADLPVFIRWLSDPEITRFTTMQAYTMEDETQWYDKMTTSGNDEIWCIHLKASDKLIGNCGYHGNTRHPGYEGEAFLGIIIGEKDEWGKGYGTDAFRTLIDYVRRKKKRPAVYLTVDTLNRPAQFVYQKLGFKTLATERNFSRVNSNEEQYLMKLDLNPDIDKR